MNTDIFSCLFCKYYDEIINGYQIKLGGEGLLNAIQHLYLLVFFYNLSEIEGIEMRATFPSLTQPKKKRFLSELESTEDKQIFQNGSKVQPRISLIIASTPQYKIKSFQDTVHWCQKVFSYVVLVLCFEVKDWQKYYGSLIDSVYELIEKQEFQFMAPDPNSELFQHSQLNLKNILSQYLNLLNEKKMSVIKSLSKYPLVLDILVLFFRTLIFLGDQCSTYDEELDMTKTLDFLISYFDIEALVTENYVFFTNANIYAVKLSQNQCFMLIPPNYENSICFNERSKIFQPHKSDISSVQGLMDSQYLKTHKTEEIRKKLKISFEKTCKKISSEDSETDEKQPNHKLRPSSSNRLNLMLFPNFESQEAIIKQEEYLHKVNEVTLGQISSIEFKKDKVRKMKHYRNKSELSNVASNPDNALQLSNPNVKTMPRSNSSFTLNNKTSSMSSAQKENNATTQKKNNLKQQKKIPADKLQSSIAVRLEALSKQVLEVDPNISTQFTNSFILDVMQEPYRSSIRETKQRIRMRRKQRQNSCVTQPI